MKRTKKLCSLVLALIMAISVMAGLSTTAFAAGDYYGKQESVTDANSAVKSGNRVYFYNMSGGKATLSDFIILESNGHWGLIDSGHRKSNVITDGQHNYACPQDNGLSSQVANKTGVDAAKYMVETLGVKHLDFIIGTHAHSDHVGGIPEIAKLKVTNAKTKKTSYLVDSSTVYIYKPYNAVNTTNDDISGATSYSWHNQAYAYQALNAMKQRGAQVVDLSNGAFINNVPASKLNYTKTVNTLNALCAVSNAAFLRGNTRYEDRLQFRFGSMNITLYNLYMHKTHIDENVNSIVATVVYNGNKLATMADINVEDRAEQQIAAAIRKNIGTVTVMKAPHHGVARGSNSKELYDLLQPQKVIVTRNVSNVTATQSAGAFANAMKYAKGHFSTVFYEVGASGYALAVDMSAKGAPVYNLTGRGKSAKLGSADSCISRMSYADGWSSWDKKWTWNNGKVTDRDIYYFKNNSYTTGWTKWNGRWFYLNGNGVMLSGWQTIGGKRYYFNNTETDGNYGAMETGWQKLGSQWYYFNSDGSMKTGWLNSNGKTYYLKGDGTMAVYTNVIGGKTYYFNGAGAMQKGWLQFNNGQWRYYNNNGVMQTGWLNSNSKTYYLKGDGAMAVYTNMIGGKTYYFNGAGAMQKGWLQFNNGQRRYYNSQGVMQTGPLTLNGKEYLLRYKDGTMITGWYHNAKGDYYYRPDGSMVKGSYVPDTDFVTKRANTARTAYYFNNSGLLVH